MDGTTHTVPVQIASPGKAAAQTAAGALTSDTATGGALLAGNLEVYVKDPGGLFTADELARIQDAVTAVDAVVEPYGVAVSETTDSTQANVVLDTGGTSAVGGYADGVLGCYTPAREITLIQGWNWYAGSDATQIGSTQFDFQTTVTHELGHALGLGESSNTASAMSGTLTTGTVIRTLTAADLNVPYDETGADGQHATVPATAAVPAQVFAPAPGPVAPAAVVSLPTAGSAPALALLESGVSLARGGTEPFLAFPGTGGGGPSGFLESAGSDDWGEPGGMPELVPLPGAADSDAPLPASAPRPAPHREGDAPADLVWWRETCTACFAADSTGNSPTDQSGPALPADFALDAAAGTLTDAADPVAALALALVLA